MRSGKSDWPAANHRNFEGLFRLLPSRVDIEGIFRLGTVAFCKESFECANRDGLIDLAASAGGLTGMGADAAADRSEWIGIARELVSFFEASFRDQSHVPAGVRVCGTGHHAGKVGIQPISI